MRFLALILTVVCAGGAGCADSRYYWHNPAKTLTEAKRDCLGCRELAVAEASEAVAEHHYSHSATASGSSGSGYGIDAGDPDHSAIQGWITWGTMYRENVFRGCMNRKGYQLVREDELSRLVRRRDSGIYRVAGR